jgi:hypothetical protein
MLFLMNMRRNHAIPIETWEEIRAIMRSDVNPVKNNVTQQLKGTQDRSTDKFEGMTSTRCL